jgi:hypothetical protein
MRLSFCLGVVCLIIVSLPQTAAVQASDPENGKDVYSSVSNLGYFAY